MQENPNAYRPSRHRRRPVRGRAAASFAEITNAFLKHHDLVANSFLTPNVIGEVSEIPRGKSSAAGKPAEIAIVELKVPSFALATPEQKQGFVADATDAVERASQGRPTARPHLGEHDLRGGWPLGHPW
jgi:hypothetical protein